MRHRPNTPSPVVKLDIKSHTFSELQAQFVAWGEPKYRVTQLLHWLYVQRTTTWEAMTNLSQTLRERLSQTYWLYAPTLVTKQGVRGETQKFLWRLSDGALIECVLIVASPALYGEPSDRLTLCVSTQVGCAYGCRFCASGLGGWKRNLRPEEIVEQVIATERWLSQADLKSQQALAGVPAVTPERHISNLVIMGMGEPLANYDALMKALQILNAPWGGRIGARKMTISTSGLVPQIRKLAEEPMQYRLAISLHGATDEVRGRIMPVNRKYPLRELLAACEYYLAKKGRILSLEYILIAGVNDSEDQIKPLAQIAHRLHAKVNLIPYNPVEGLSWQRPSESSQTAFLTALRSLKVSATVRREKGTDIDAACGQLRLKTESNAA
jgi:23S rRNA (adenine2503-C2)-methyltransferase